MSGPAASCSCLAHNCTMVSHDSETGPEGHLTSWLLHVCRLNSSRCFPALTTLSTAPWNWSTREAEAGRS